MLIATNVWCLSSQLQLRLLFVAIYGDVLPPRRHFVYLGDCCTAEAVAAYFDSKATDVALPWL